jgi:ketosteroid isomerase-like protein
MRRTELWRFIPCLVLMGCLYLVGSTTRRDNSSSSTAESELLAVHAADRRAHFERDVDGLLAHVGDEIVDVREGNVRRMTRDELRSRFRDYFAKARFSAWDDLAAPVVHVSPDGRLGWMIVQVQVSYTEHGKARATDETLAWMSAYEKRNGTWMLTAVTTTRLRPRE